jgi:hypothetical protein
MKYFYTILIAFGFTSCVTFKQYDNRAKAAKEDNYTVAIIKNDGTVVKGESLKCKNIHPQEPNLAFVTEKNNAFQLDDQKYSDKDIVAFQDKRGFHKRLDGRYLMRLFKGKMNLYYFDNISSSKNTTFKSSGGIDTKTDRTRKSIFYFEKEKDVLVQIGISELKNALKDNDAALAKLNSYYPKDNYRKELDIEKLITVFNLYNK